MRILVFSDIHSDLVRLGELMGTEADLYIAAGDLVSWARGLDKAAAVMRPKADRVWLIPGNHESPADISKFCQTYGFHDLHGQSLEIDGVHVAGLGCSSPTPFHTPGEYSEREISERLAPFAGKNPLVLICHCPPKGTRLDRAGEKLHFGSTAVREFIDREQPVRFFCGHIHEAEGATEQLGATLCVNVGKRGYLLDVAAVIADGRV
jgi:Icc-related predicted phosphoesterase